MLASPSKPRLPKLNVLFSYAYIRDDTFQAEVICRLSPVIDFLIDSGAFTNHSMTLKSKATGKAYNPITLNEYIAACRQYEGKVWQFIALDVLGDPVATHANLAAMLDAGLTPMPVFVNGDKYEWANDLVRINPHICVGGVVGAKPEFAVQRYQRVSAATGGKARIHSLGFVRWPTIFQVPLFSCDSSSWDGGGRWGTISRFLPNEGIKATGLSELRERDKASAPWLDFLVQCGVDIAHLAHEDTYRKTTGLPAQTTVNAFIGLHREATRRGRKFFFAVPNMNWLNNLLGVVAAYKGGPFDLRESLAVKEHLDSLYKGRDVGAYTDAIWKVVAGATA